MSIFYRFVFIFLFSLQFFSSAIVDFFGIRHVVNTIFISCILIIIFYSVFYMRYQTKFGAFEKTFSSILVLITLLILLRDIYFDSFYVEGYKFLFVLMVIFCGLEMSRLLSVESVASDYWVLCSLYVVLVSIFVVLLGLDDVLKPTGPGGVYTRLSVTGSVTGTAITAAFSVLFSVPLFLEKGRMKMLLGTFVCLFGFYVLFLCASRQVLLVIGIYFVFMFFLAGQKGLSLGRRVSYVFAFLFFLILIFFVFTKFVNDSMYVRVFENPSSDYSSGRLDSMRSWLYEMEVRGAPLGLGYVGNNVVEEVEFLWPHNEFIRFYVEGGVIGLLIPFSLLAYALFSVLITISSKVSFRVKNLSVAVFSVLLVQVGLDNIFNNIILCSPLFFIISLCANFSYSGGLSGFRVINVVATSKRRLGEYC